MKLSRRTFLPLVPAVLTGAAFALPALVGRHRARDLGVRIGRLDPGPLNAVTDVPGVLVGHATLVRGHGELRVGEGPVRTGVTAVWPHADVFNEYVPCGFDVPNGNGEVTGLLQAADLGVLHAPLCLTNTSSVGMVYDALLEHVPPADRTRLVPVVGETWDGFLNDVEGRHVHREHVAEALRNARSGPVAEGSVGGGTGMICYEFKGGIGTASRRLEAPLADYTVGVLVQANHGSRELLRIDGVPVGEELTDLPPRPEYASAPPLRSIVMVVATDAPLLDYQLDRLARRAVHGLARTGSISGNSSGDFTIAFSTANRIPRDAFWEGETFSLRSIEQFDVGPLFEAASEATEEAITNALFLAEDMEGVDGHKVHALPLERTLEILKRHHRLFPQEGGASFARL